MKGPNPSACAPHPQHFPDVVHFGAKRGAELDIHKAKDVRFKGTNIRILRQLGDDCFRPRVKVIAWWRADGVQRDKLPVLKTPSITDLLQCSIRRNLVNLNGEEIILKMVDKCRVMRYVIREGRIIRVLLRVIIRVVITRCVVIFRFGLCRDRRTGWA